LTSPPRNFESRESAFGCCQLERLLVAIATALMRPVRGSRIAAPLEHLSILSVMWRPLEVLIFTFDRCDMLDLGSVARLRLQAVRWRLIDAAVKAVVQLARSPKSLNAQTTTRRLRPTQTGFRKGRRTDQYKCSDSLDIRSAKPFYNGATSNEPVCFRALYSAGTNSAAGRRVQLAVSLTSAARSRFITGQRNSTFFFSCSSRRSLSSVKMLISSVAASK
jgi:hypothetical protein